jgi:hypothetical protein
MYQSSLHNQTLSVEARASLGAAELAEWVAFLAAAQHQHPRQDPRFATVERADGNSVLHVTGRDAAGTLRAVGLFTLKQHPLLPGAFVWASCLSGPVCDQAETLVDFLEGVRRLPAFARVGRLRATPFWTDAAGAALQRRFAAAGWTVEDAEPVRLTGWVDIARPAEAVLAGFSKSARRELRRAERQGIAIRPLVTRDEAGMFLDSLNRLRRSRGLRRIAAPGFLAAFEMIHAAGETGVILGAFHEDIFVSGLQLYRSCDVAHGRHFTLEPERLRALSNLRIAPLVWFAGMNWAQAHGCTALDVEGWRADVQEGDYGYGIQKYKGEFAPAPVQRIAEQGRVGNAAINGIDGIERKLRQVGKWLLRRGKPAHHQ